MILVFSAAAIAGPIVVPTPEAVNGGSDAAVRLAWVLVVSAAPVFGWFAHDAYVNFKARRAAREHRNLQ